ncbi:hypothetical protein ACFVIM_17840 [Streptomyces sp. NPDC057638]|uniref:hypothetical protein n=1 Tax=Streptomyces sp. NPDC057638 TaxID=3346190 RepID=UPI0036B09576
MSNRRTRRMVVAAALTAALGLLLPVGTAQAAACQWQQTAWELPPTVPSGTLLASDGGRYGIGITGIRSTNWPFDYRERRGTLWENGRVVLRLPAATPNLRDVNTSGKIVGDDLINGTWAAVTVSRGGATTVLPSSPNWSGSSAHVINNAGDIAGTASIGLKRVLVVWPASAPGTYRELATPADSSPILAGIDEQGRIVGHSAGRGFVTDVNGQWHTLYAPGPHPFSTPHAIRDGRVVGDMDNGSSYAVAEWNDQGALVRTITQGALSAKAIGGHGTVGGSKYVASVIRPVLWRDGVVSDPLTTVSDTFTIKAISDDEKTLIGNDISRPAQYTCS